MSYNIQFYVNGYLTSHVEGLSPNEAYTQAVSGEALNQVPGSRWHAILRVPALEHLDSLLEGETLRVCWQGPPENNWSDTEHVLIIKNPVGIHMQTPPPAPPPSILPNNLIADIQALINNMLMNQDNQQNLINNIRNRIFVMNNPNATYNNNPNATNLRG